MRRQRVASGEQLLLVLVERSRILRDLAARFWRSLARALDRNFDRLGEKLYDPIRECKRSAEPPPRHRTPAARVSTPEVATAVGERVEVIEACWKRRAS